MASFKVEFAHSATKDLRRIDRQWVVRILDAVEGLATDCRPVGCKKLAGSERTYRIRLGDYRVIYDIHDTKLVVFVIRVRHRRDVYR